MRAREIAHTKRDDNRVVRPFAWGAEFIREHANGDDPHIVFGDHTERVMARSEDFYPLPEVSDWQLAGDRLAWTSAIKTPASENKTGRARLVTTPPERKNNPRAAAVVLQQWNAQPDSHGDAFRIFTGVARTARP